MHRRTFLRGAAALPAALGKPAQEALPKYKVVSRYQGWPQPGMPGPLPGRVVSVHSAKAIDAESEKVDAPTVREMMSQGMRALTGAGDVRDGWSRLFTPSDVVGIKVNCSGAPGICSTPEVVAEIVRNLNEVGVKPESIWIYERFQGQMDTVRYDRYVPAGVHIFAAEGMRGSPANYDPFTYVEVDFFGEDDT